MEFVIDLDVGTRIEKAEESVFKNDKQLNKGGKIMNLVRFKNPYYSVNRNLVDDLFNNFLRNDYDENYLRNCGRPATNVLESEKDFRIEMMLPGFKKEDVQINFHKNLLTVKVDKEELKENSGEGLKYAQREFGEYNFEKQFKVPNSVENEKIDANFENGILSIVLPKKEEEVEKAPVAIKIS